MSAKDQVFSNEIGDQQTAQNSAQLHLEHRTMHVFISRALQKVLKEAPKKHTELRQSCAAVIGEPA